MTETPTRPAYPNVNLDGIPAELIDEQWTTWRWAWRKDKWTKPPINPRTGAGAEADNPETWVPYEEAWAFAQRRSVGIGRFFYADDPYFGIDLDKCRDPETGSIDAWALEVIEAFGTYAEPSVSGTGIHLIGRGHIPGDRRRTGQIEMYDAERYFTFTGQPLEGYEQITDCQDALDTFYAETFPAPAPTTPRSVQPLTLGDQDLIAKVRSARNGAKFDRLYTGDTSEYGNDESAADLAFVSMLTFYTDDRNQIDRIVRQSGRYREKWDRPDYRERTIEKALQRSTFYEPQQARPTLHIASSTPQMAAGATEPAETPPDPCAERVAELERQLAAERDRRIVAEARVAALEERLSLVFQVQRAKPIKQQSPVFLASVNEIASAESRGLAEADGWVSTYRAAIGERAGCGEKTVTSHLDILADELGLLERRTIYRDRERHDPETGQSQTERVKVLQIRIPPQYNDVNDVMRAATTKTRENQPAWGGTRTPCPHCGGTEFEIRKITACVDCGCILEDRRSRVTVSEAHETPVQVVKGQDDLLVADEPSSPAHVVDASLDGNSLPFTPTPTGESPSKGASCSFSPPVESTCRYCPSPLYTPESIARGTCARHAAMYPSQFPMVAGGAD